MYEIEQVHEQASVDVLHPLSIAQLGIWFAQVLDSSSPIFNVGECLEIFGPVDEAYFEAAVRQAVREIDGLRVQFVVTGQGPMQRIAENPHFEVVSLDFSHEPDPRASAIQWMKDDILKAPNPLGETLFNFALLRCSENHFFKFHRYHHLVADGVSVLLVANRIASIYALLLEGKTPADESTPSWLDLLADQDKYRQSSQYERDRDYWKKQLEGRSAVETFSGKPPARSRSFIRCASDVPAALVEGLRAMAGLHQVSLPQLITAAGALYLHRWTGAQDLTLGMPVVGRIGQKMRRIFGNTTNVLPLRLRINRGDTLATVLLHVAQQTRTALRHQLYRAEDLRRELGLHPHDPEVYGLVVNVEPFDYSLRFGGHLTHQENVAAGPVDDFSIVAFDRLRGSDMKLYFNANPEHYSPAELSGHAHRFLRFMETMVQAEPETEIEQLEILSLEERQQLLEGFNASGHEVDRDATFPSLFEAWVERAPQAEAVAFRDSKLSYAELNAQANRLAHYLIAQGVGPESLVGVALDRSFAMVVALIAILKAGGAYLPLDPNYPQARLAHMVADAAPAVVLTSSNVHLDLPLDTGLLDSGLLDTGLLKTGLKVVHLDSEDIQSSIAEQHQHNPTNADRRFPLLAQHPAYVIYTSGSTGIPNGVVVTHSGLSSLAGTQLESLALTPQSRVLQFASLNFDASLWELVMAFTTGAALVLIAEQERNGAQLWQVIAKERITHTLLPLAVLNTLEEEHPPQELPLPVLIVGGEACSAEYAEKWSVGRRMVNAYGPTEATVCATISAPLSGPKTPSLGSPVWNAKVYVLDGNMEPVPVGVGGEIYIAGSGLARGYLRRPGLTAERFLPNPLSGMTGMSGKGGERLYRTGDMGRWQENGTLDYLGRVDQQVKIRGFRIELGEIEAALKEQAGVAQVVVVARTEGSGSKHLVAYVVPEADAALGAESLRGQLRERLPDYMVPSAFVTLEALPLLPNGKLDRQSLPAPNLRNEGSRVPRNHLEQMLCVHFAEVLGVDHLGIDDNFFLLGGDSLTAMKLVWQLRSTLGVNLSVGALFASPTVAELAARIAPPAQPTDSSDSEAQEPALAAPTGIQAVPDEGAFDQVLALRARGRLPALFCFSPIVGLGWMYAGLLREIDRERPLYAIQARGATDTALLPVSFEAMIEEQVEAILRIQPDPPYHLLGWSFGGYTAYAVGCRLQQRGGMVPMVTLLDTYPLPDISEEQRAELENQFDEVSEQKTLREVASLVGVDMNQFDEQLIDAATVVEVARRNRHVIGFFEPRLLERYVQLTRHRLRLLLSMKLGRYEGDMLHFVAAQEDSQHKAESWDTFVRGRVDIHQIGCGHLNMADPQHISEIGRVLEQRLKLQVPTGSASGQEEAAA
ncbi:MAG TPA: amino acid adenylation domain-containing protein [Candidatus Angelobacter sp.]|nr:amino acid adenylation domain-containing protein [Candidatus Angelobacter sp.]